MTREKEEVVDIYVGNLAYSSTDSDLRELFEAHGNVTSARVVMDKFSGQSRGFGFVEMPDRAEADIAIAQINGVDFQGRRLRVNESRPRAESGSRSGGGGERRDRY